MRLYLSHKERLTEDHLTAILMDLIDWWPDAGLVRNVCAAARTFERNGAFATLPEWDSFAIEPWPRWPVGEPDIVLRLHARGQLAAMVVIEAKLGAAKSGEDDEDAEIADAGVGDQLARYHWHASKEHPETHIIYLTHHAAMPRDDLAASLRAMRRRGTSAAASLHWLSWRDVEQVLRSLLPSLSADFRPCVEAALRVFRHAGLCHFEGRWLSSSPPPSKASTPLFYRRPAKRRYGWPVPRSLERRFNRSANRGTLFYRSEKS